MKRISITEGPCEWGEPVSDIEHRAKMDRYREGVAAVIAEQFPAVEFVHRTDAPAGTIPRYAVLDLGTGDEDDAAAGLVRELALGAWMRAAGGWRL
jgi:hypothetical protein